VASYLPATRYGGTIWSVHGLCKALAARGHDVQVFTTSVDGDRDSDVPHGTPVEVDGVTVWYFRSTRGRRIYWAPEMAAALAERIGDCAVVHTHAIFLWPLWAAARAAHRAHVPYVVSPRGMLERDLVSRTSPLLKATWIAAIERHNLERAAAIHVTSAREADEAAAFGLRLPCLHEIPNGVEPSAGAAQPSPSVAAIISGEPYVLFLGRLHWKKGLDRLVAALSRVRGARLLVAGNDEDGYRPTIEAQASRAGVALRVTFTGPVHGADKAALLEHAQVLVLPSYSENFGNVVLEAMAAGCPVVVTPEVGIAPIVQTTGAGIVVEGDADSLGRAIDSVCGREDVRVALGERGRHAVATSYSWPRVAEQFEDLYASVANRAGAQP
jgi:glycosyltransferase involved in cell wall biosynthesis